MSENEYLDKLAAAVAANLDENEAAIWTWLAFGDLIVQDITTELVDAIADEWNEFWNEFHGL